MRVDPRTILAMVTSFREGREIPQNLFGHDRPDQTVAVITDTLDKIFATLSGFEYREEFASGGRKPLLELVIVDRQMLGEAADVVQLTFRSADGGELPAWDPGAHVDFFLPSGRMKQYSLCGDRHDRSTYQVAVRRMPAAGGSWEMHELEVGSVIQARNPRNGFPFSGGGSALFLAGGIGITPILPMVREAQELGLDWFLVYTGRSRATLPYLDEIEGWDPERVLVRTDEELGPADVSELLERAPAGGAVYCCGPGPMINAVLEGFDDTNAVELHFERFGAAPVIDGVEFEVELAKSQRVVTVPATKTMLEAVRAEISDVSYSCQQGFCGTCRTRVLAGTPEHRDKRLTAEEKETEMLICVSRSAGERLVLDL